MGAMNAKHLEELTKIVGPNYASTDAQKLAAYGRDWTKFHEPNAALVLFPADTAQVSAILKYCNVQKLAVIPSGGRTGLAGGAVATNGEIILSLDRLNKIERVDTVGLTITVQAGVTCQAVQQAAENAGMFFALDLASKGSCQIGGNLATNAGGLKLIRYGGAREQVLGVEVVLADGTVMDMNYSLRKNNTGVDLKQLFIATEGTLGIITKAVLRMMPKPKELILCCMSVKSFQDIPELVQLLNKRRLWPTALEFFSDKALRLVEKFHSSLRSPFADAAAYYVLLELDGEGRAAEEVFEPIVSEALESDLVQDAVIAASSAQFKALWGLRENISESISQYGHVRKNDISLPIDCLEGFVSDLDRLITTAPKEIELILFGHIGDGNLHINYIAPPAYDRKTFLESTRELEEKIFALLPNYRGSISAEHGIGLLKKDDLKFSKTAIEIEWMRKIKNLFDPNHTLNPGKILD